MILYSYHGMPGDKYSELHSMAARLGSGEQSNASFGKYTHRDVLQRIPFMGFHLEKG